MEDEGGFGDGFTSLRLLRTMFTEYQLRGWHIVSSNISNQRLIVDFKFSTGRSSVDRQALGPSTLFCMQIVKQLYTYLKIRQWTVVSGDRETETIHFSFTFEFKRDISRLPSSCLRPIVAHPNRLSRSHQRRWYDTDDTMSQLMNIMRDLERLDSHDDYESKSVLKSSTSGAVTENTDGDRRGSDSLLLATPPMRRSMWFDENEPESDATDQQLSEELANWRTGVCLRSTPYYCSPDASLSTTSSYRSRSAIRRPIARRPICVETAFRSICTSSDSPKPQMVPSPSKPDVEEPNAKTAHGRSRSAVPPTRRGRDGHLFSLSEIKASDPVEPCFLRRPIIGEGRLIGNRKDSGIVSDSVDSSSKANCEKAESGSTSSATSAYATVQKRQAPPADAKEESADQCSMCKRKLDSFDKQCDNCKRRYCAECIWWCVLSKRRRCLMCYSGAC